MTGKSPDYRETVEKLRELVAGRKVQHMEPGAFIEHDRWDSQCPFCMRDLDALLTAQADELATVKQARDDAATMAKSRWDEINIHLQVIHRMNASMQEMAEEYHALLGAFLVAVVSSAKAEV
jgi:hypothetical protein